LNILKSLVVVFFSIQRLMFVICADKLNWRHGFSVKLLKKYFDKHLIIFQFALVLAAIAMALGAPAAATPEAEVAEAAEKPVDAPDSPKDKRAILALGYGYTGYPAYATHYTYGYGYPAYHTAYPGYAYHYPYSYYVG